MLKARNLCPRPGLSHYWAIPTLSCQSFVSHKYPDISFNLPSFTDTICYLTPVHSILPRLQILNPKNQEVSQSSSYNSSVQYLKTVLSQRYDTTLQNGLLPLYISPTSPLQPHGHGPQPRARHVHGETPKFKREMGNQPWRASRSERKSASARYLEIF